MTINEGRRQKTKKHSEESLFTQKIPNYTHKLPLNSEISWATAAVNCCMQTDAQNWKIMKSYAKSPVFINKNNNKMYIHNLLKVILCIRLAFQFQGNLLIIIYLKREIQYFMLCNIYNFFCDALRCFVFCRLGCVVDLFIFIVASFLYTFYESYRYSYLCRNL